MDLTIKRKTDTEFGIYVNGQLETLYDGVTAFEPQTYFVVVPPSKTDIEFLSNEYK